MPNKKRSSSSNACWHFVTIKWAKCSSITCSPVDGVPSGKRIQIVDNHNTPKIIHTAPVHQLTSCHKANILLGFDVRGQQGMDTGGSIVMDYEILFGQRWHLKCLDSGFYFLQTLAFHL